MAQEARPRPPRPVLYQLGRLGDRFVPGDPPLDLSREPRPLILGRTEPGHAVGAGRIVVDDPWMSARHARLGDGGRPATRAGVASQRLFIEDLGSKAGVFVNGVLSPKAPLLHGDLIETGHTFWIYVEERCSEPVLTAAVECGAFVTWHPRLGAELTSLQSSSSARHVLISGPDGSGKGFLARTLHQVSGRTGRFLQLDCAEKRPRKLVVELFGKDGLSGRLKDAAGGTLLLERLEAMPIELQHRLAEVLNRRALVVDGTRVPVDVRVIATCRTAHAGALPSALQAPLLDALDARVALPALDERLCDLGLLLDDFLSRAKGATRISREACRVLFRHRFGQHVRGFARVVEAASSLAADDVAEGGIVSVEHLPYCVAGVDTMRALLQRANELAGVDAEPMAHPHPLLSATAEGEADDDGDDDRGFSSVIQTDAERVASLRPAHRARGTVSDIGPGAPAHDAEADADADAIADALRTARGNVAAAARILSRPRAVVMRWCRDLGLDPLSFRSGPSGS
jgi:DNA-binding NtrC family response regulator